MTLTACRGENRLGLTLKVLIVKSLDLRLIFWANLTFPKVPIPKQFIILYLLLSTLEPCNFRGNLAYVCSFGFSCFCGGCAVLVQTLYEVYVGVVQIQRLEHFSSVLFTNYYFAPC